MIWAVILAAGESRRMGGQKLLLPYGGHTVIETIVKTALDSSLDGTMVVLGADEVPVRKVLKPYPVRLAVNKDYRLGMLSTIQTGFKHLPHNARAALVMLGDQPEVPVHVIEEILRAYGRGDKGIVIPVAEGRRGHPVLIEAAYKSEVLGLDPGVGLRQLMSDHPGDVAEVEVAAPGILSDLDVPEDYSGALGRRRRKDGSGGGGNLA
jgi:molybdenum cofactor cytidylyltransferase